MLVAAVAAGSAAATSADTTQARTFLTLLGGVEHEYREAFDGAGKLVRPLELDEATLLLKETCELAPRLGLDPSADLQAQMTALTDAVATRAAVDVVADLTRQVRDTVQNATGIVADTVPPNPPSAASGKKLYATHCVACHGDEGKGDGVAARQLERRPADFTDVQFMRRETPADFFLVISLGRRGASMPSWKDSLSVQERWDLVSYVWSLHSPVQSEAASDLFVAHCQGCHSATLTLAGERETDAAPPWDWARLSARSDADLYVVIGEGHSATHLPSAVAGLSEAERWALVAFTRDLAFASVVNAAVGDAAGGERMAAALQRVAYDVEAALDAYRLRDPDAPTLGHLAYLAFEPLEPAIATRDADAVRRVEADFKRLQRALRQPDASYEVEAAAKAVTRGLASATQLMRSSPSLVSGLTLVTAAAAGCVIALLILVAAKRR